jgi:hypothetical protein
MISPCMMLELRDWRGTHYALLELSDDGTILELELLHPWCEAEQLFSMHIGMS